MGIEKPKGQKQVSEVRDETKQELGELSKTLKFEHKFPLGESALPKKKQKEVDSLPFEKGKLYDFEGTVDQVPFRANLKSARFYRKQADYARQILEDFDNVRISFSMFKGAEGKGRAKEMLQYIADSVPADPKAPFDTKKWKMDTELKYSSEQIYGAEGIFNLVLAYKRAVDKMRGRVKDSQAHATFELKLSNKEMSERSLRVFEVNKLAEKVLRESVKTGRTNREIFNDEFMTDAAKRRWDLVLKIGEYKRDERLFSSQADALVNKLNALDCHDISTHPEYRDYERFDSIFRTIVNVEEVVQKYLEQNTVSGKKLTASPAEESRESVAAREHARRIESILNRGELKDRYAIAENLEATVTVVVEDVIKVCHLPVQFNLKTLQDLKVKLAGIVRARVNSAVNGGSKEIVFDKKDKTTLVEIVLQVVDYEKGLQGAAKNELLRDKTAY